MDDYAHFHQDRGNLLIHIVAVPVFVLTALGSVGCLVSGRWLAAGLLALGPVLSLAAQGHGHKGEANPPRPFSGPGDFVRRILTEQFVTFPLFVGMGRWAEAVRRGGPATRKSTS